jgi:tripartite-type tricarboxylate transporter receptor subunit TctC
VPHTKERTIVMNKFRFLLKCTSVFAAAACFAVQFSAAAMAQAYPNKPIRYIVADGPGGGADTIGRIVAAGLTKELGVQVVVENHAGAAGNIGMEVAVKAAPDGYTLVEPSSSHTANVNIYKDLKYNLLKDFIPVTQISSLPMVVAVHPKVNVKTMKELLDLAKSKPGSLNYGSMGVGSVPWVATGLLESMAKIKLEHIGYKGGGATMLAIVSGEVDVYLAPIAPALAHIKQGKLRALAVTSAKRSPVLPDVPTIAESGVPGYELVIWHGLMLPAGTPKDIVTKVQAAVAKVMKDPAVIERLNTLAFVPVASSPEEFGAFIKNDIEKQAGVLKNAGVAPK